MKYVIDQDRLDRLILKYITDNLGEYHPETNPDSYELGRFIKDGEFMAVIAGEDEIILGINEMFFDNIFRIFSIPLIDNKVFLILKDIIKDVTGAEVGRLLMI